MDDDQLPPSRHLGGDDDATGDPATGPAARLRRSFGGLAALVVLVLVAGLLGGVLYGRSNPRGAASSLLGDRVVEVADTSLVILGEGPTTGGTARCGVLDGPLSPADQRASLDAGTIVILLAEPLDPANLRAFTTGRAVVVAAVPAGVVVERPVQARARLHVLDLPEPTPELLSAFVTAFGGRGPDSAGSTCPA